MKILTRVYSVLPILLVVWSIFNGGIVLLGFREPHYSPYPLIIFYTSMAFLELLTIFYVWKEHKHRLQFSIFIVMAHSIVTAMLIFIFEDIAIQNIVGLTIRAIVWAIMVLLLFLLQRKATDL